MIQLKQLREFERESGLEIYGLGLDRAKWEAATAKFGELVIRKCATIAWQNTPDTEELEYGNLIADKIKEHFGVE